MRASAFMVPKEFPIIPTLSSDRLSCHYTFVKLFQKRLQLWMRLRSLPNSPAKIRLVSKPG